MKIKYFRDANKTPLLTATQEIELARIIREGAGPNATNRQVVAAKRATQKFATANLKLVFKIAWKYEKSAGKLEIDDLIQFGSEGLLRAIAKFDYERGYKFSTYAYAWIRQAIQRGIADQSRTIRLPTHAHDELRSIRKIVAAHRAAGNKEPLRDEDIAARLNIPIDRYMQMRRVWSDAGSTDASILEGTSEQAMTYSPVIEDDERERQKATLLDLVYQLPEQEKNIMVWRHGLNGEQPMTLEEIGRRIGLCRERVRQIDVALTDKLRALLT